jgi:hypothetical protein
MKTKLFLSLLLLASVRETADHVDIPDFEAETSILRRYATANLRREYGARTDVKPETAPKTSKDIAKQDSRIVAMLMNV